MNGLANMATSADTDAQKYAYPFTTDTVLRSQLSAFGQAPFSANWGYLSVITITSSFYRLFTN